MLRLFLGIKWIKKFKGLHFSKKLHMKTSILKPRTIKSLKEEQILSGTKWGVGWNSNKYEVDHRANTQFLFMLLGQTILESTGKSHNNNYELVQMLCLPWIISQTVKRRFILLLIWNHLYIWILNYFLRLAIKGEIFTGKISLINTKVEYIFSFEFLLQLKLRPFFLPLIESQKINGTRILKGIDWLGDFPFIIEPRSLKFELCI